MPPGSIQSGPQGLGGAHREPSKGYEGEGQRDALHSVGRSWQTCHEHYSEPPGVNRGISHVGSLAEMQPRNWPLN